MTQRAHAHAYYQIYAVANEHVGQIFSKDVAKDYIKKFEALHEKTKSYYFGDIADSLRKYYEVS
jgi:hypothetical protein